jgi:Ca2+-binding RTX toxin-like protein
MTSVGSTRSSSPTYSFPEEGDGSARPSDGPIYINGGKGNDKIHIRDDDDGGVCVEVNGEEHFFTREEAERLVIRGGKGDDRIVNKTDIGLSIDGGAGDDVLTGGGGDDRIRGGAGDDRIRGVGGDDEVYGGTGDDDIDGGRGNDKLSGNGGDDLIRGDRGDDKIYGGAGDDDLDGGKGNDRLQGDRGDDCVQGGSGTNTIVDEEKVARMRRAKDDSGRMPGGHDKCLHEERAARADGSSYIDWDALYVRVPMSRA